MRFLLTILISLTFYLSFSQEEASHWYFGDGGGLIFDVFSGDVVSNNDASNTINTGEGCATISDFNGNLLFYTDGRSVWNKNHELMPNADYFGGSGLLGDPSSTSSAIIIPKPGSTSLYYIFTIDEPHQDNASVYPNQFTGNYTDNGGSIPNIDNGYNDGVSYSLLDLDLENGLGNIAESEKNVQLITYNPFNNSEASYKSSEKVTAIASSDGDSYWVVVHFKNKFYSFNVSEAGVNTEAVISTVGPMISTNGYRRNAIGHMKISPDGSRLAICHNENGNVTGENSFNTGSFWLFNFNNETGKVTGGNLLESDIEPYGTEFSPDSKKLYVTYAITSDISATQYKIKQFDLNTPNLNSTTIPRDNEGSIRSLQLAPNGKIYVASTSNTSTLDAINSPNETGINCDYQTSVVTLAPGTTVKQGLPSFIQSILLANIRAKNLCFGDLSEFTINISDSIIDIFWDFGDGSTSNELNPVHQYLNSGSYNVSAIVTTSQEVKEFEKTITISDTPVANQISETIIGCDPDDDSIASFDFSQLDSQILGSQTNPNFNVHYYETNEDAINDTNEITGIYENSSNPQEIFVRVDNDTNSNCFNTTSFFIEIYKKPIANPIDDLPICDQGDDGSFTNGLGEFDLSTLDNAVLMDQNPLDFSITYHNNPNDALLNLNPLPEVYSNSTPFSETIYVRIENNIKPECFDITSTNLIVNSIPEAFNADLIQCDDLTINGSTLFNLNEAYNDLTGGIDNVSTNFFVSLNDALNSINEIPDGIYNNISNPQTIYVQVINNTTDCFNISELTLEVLDVSIQIFEAPDVCDEIGSEDGYHNFNLDNYSETILNGINAEINYYETLEDALLEQNSINNGSFTNTIPYSQSIYARLEIDNNCSNLVEVKLKVNELPQTEDDITLYSCLNLNNQTFTINSGVIGNPSNYSYQWFFNDGMLNSNSSSIEIEEIGQYRVIITNSNDCSKQRLINLEASNIATIEDVEVTDISNNNTITVLVSGEGFYNFALDDINGPYQESNFFNNVEPGIHTVYVKDVKNNCGITESIVSVIGFPRFFTPNGDNYNERWNIKGLSDQFLPNSEIMIFNRYGKLITKISPLGPGWDGTLNGNKLPADDYWFLATLEDGRVYKNHFALKR